MTLDQMFNLACKRKGVVYHSLIMYAIYSETLQKDDNNKQFVPARDYFT